MLNDLKSGLICSVVSCSDSVCTVRQELHSNCTSMLSDQDVLSVALIATWHESRARCDSRRLELQGIRLESCLAELDRTLPPELESSLREAQASICDPGLAYNTLTSGETNKHHRP